MTCLGFFGGLGWPWVLEQVLSSFEIVKITDGRLNVKIASYRVWKRKNEEIESYDEKREILPKIVKTSHFNIGILDKPEVFSRQFLCQNNDRNPKLCLLFEN